MTPFYDEIHSSDYISSRGIAEHAWSQRTLLTNVTKKELRSVDLLGADKTEV